jgi:hypothetical protein
MIARFHPAAEQELAAAKSSFAFRVTLFEFWRLRIVVSDRVIGANGDNLEVFAGCGCP